MKRNHSILRLIDIRILVHFPSLNPTSARNGAVEYTGTRILNAAISEKFTNFAVDQSILFMD